MVERFIKEYVNYKVRTFPINCKDDYPKRDEYKKSLDKIVSTRERGMITCDESIKLILNESVIK